MVKVSFLWSKQQCSPTETMVSQEHRPPACWKVQVLDRSEDIALLCIQAVTYHCIWVSFECVCNSHFFVISTFIQNQMHEEHNKKLLLYKRWNSAIFICALTCEVPTETTKHFQSKLSGESSCLWTATITHTNFHLYLDLM